VGIVVAGLGIGFLSRAVVKKVYKPLIDELKDPSPEMIAFANQGHMDDYQKKALLSPFKQTLVIAGAGAGKTEILKKRIVLFYKYLKIPIKNMLVMAFNKDAALEVATRVGDAIGQKPQFLKDNIRTIHSFAYSIAREENPNFDIIIDEKQMKNFVKNVLEKHKTGKNMFKYMGTAINLFGNVKPREKIQKYKTVAEPGKSIRCSDGTMVRSYAEKRIAEALIKNKINFVYETMVAWGDKYFEPDFFFPDYGVYAEYWGMMHHENASIREKYREQMQWKKEQFKKYGFRLIDLEPQVNEFQKPPEEWIITRLKNYQSERFVQDYQIRLRKMFNIIEDKVVELIISTLEITMAYSIKMKKLMPGADPLIKAVLAFIIPFCEELETSMNMKNKVTFTKILYLAVKRLRDDKALLKKLREKYKCIFVDEVQDLQPLTRQFIRLLTGKKQNLFAIGDDYQSIYSFAGSDPMFIIKFEHYFPEAQVLKLKFNYRCHPKIVEISNKIIKNNRSQRFKEVKGNAVNGQQETDKVLTVLNVLDETKAEELADYLLAQIPENESIQILGRYSEAMPEIEPYMKVLNKKLRRRNYKYMTIHKSKGLQADNVIILGCVNSEDGAFCFPAKDNFHRIKDRILALCRGNKFSLAEEETRLFYVAVTRAKKRVFVVTVRLRESEFVLSNFLPEGMVSSQTIGYMADFTSNSTRE
jgi:DNA helicase-4